jgi:hypothetical protein
VLLFLLKLQKRALFVRELFHVVRVSHFREKERKICGEERSLCFLGKKEKKSTAEREKKQKEWNTLHLLVRFC